MRKQSVNMVSDTNFSQFEAVIILNSTVSTLTESGEALTVIPLLLQVSDLDDDLIFTPRI